MWTVTRQHQWPDGNNVVEISHGGIDYCNPDALSAKYPGEFQEFADPVEAVETAIKIAEAWRKDTKNRNILIDHGATGGNTMPFDGMRLNRDTCKQLRQWAKEQRDALPKCDRCGDIIVDNKGEGYTLIDYDDFHFCSEQCAERFWEDEQRALAEELGEDEEVEV